MHTVLETSVEPPNGSKDNPFSLSSIIMDEDDALDATRRMNELLESSLTCSGKDELVKVYRFSVAKYLDINFLMLEFRRIIKKYSNDYELKDFSVSDNFYHIEFLVRSNHVSRLLLRLSRIRNRDDYGSAVSRLLNIAIVILSVLFIIVLFM